MSHPVVFVLGPTAVGKSQFAVQAAEEFSGVILNCDSVQSYQRVCIGAAKPFESDLARVPHFMFDWIPPKQEMTAANFRRRAMRILPGLLEKSPVFAVGGSGFYQRALEKGLFLVKDVPPARKLHWENRLQAEGAAVLYQELKDVDPQTAVKVNPNDHYRIVRALSLMETEERTLTEIRAAHARQISDWHFPTLKIGLELPRAALIHNIQNRVEMMMAQGLMEEVERLLEEGLESWAPLGSVGYREVVAHLKHPVALSVLKEQITVSTSQLAKKQMTWFRSDPSIKWFQSVAPWTEVIQWLKPRLIG